MLKAFLPGLTGYVLLWLTEALFGHAAAILLGVAILTFCAGAFWAAGKRDTPA